MIAATSPVEHLPPSRGPDRSWQGLAMLTGGKGYADAPLGQIHYRDLGPVREPPPLLLFHQSPMSMVEFGSVQNALADLGVQSIAPDTPGYGLSDQPSCVPTVGGLADNFVHLLDRLAIERAVVAGHHTGACIATALAARHPDRVAGVILHGCPLYTPEESARAQARTEWDRSAKLDGGQLSLLFCLFAQEREPTPEETFVWTWMSLTMFLQGPDFGHWAVDRYDMAADLARISCPGLIVTEVHDIIHHMDARASASRPDFAMRTLAGPGATGIMTRPKDWVAVVLDWMGSVGLREGS